MTISQNSVIDGLLMTEPVFNTIFEPEPDNRPCMEPEPNITEMEPEPETNNIDENKPMIDARPEKMNRLEISNLSKRNLATLLIIDYSRKNSVARNKEKASCKKIIAECKDKQLISNAYLGKPITETVKDLMLNVWLDRAKNIENNHLLGKTTETEYLKLKGKNIKPVFIPTKTAKKDGTVMYRLYDTGNYRESFTISELINVATTCNLQRTKVKRLLDLYELRNNSIGSELVECEKEINSIINLSPEWVEIKGKAFDIEYFELRSRKNHYQTKFDRNGNRIKFYNFKLSCMRICDNIETGKADETEFIEFAKETGCTVSELRNLIR